DAPARPAASSRPAASGRSAAVGRGKSAEPAGPRRPQIDREGRATIACPNCGARYKIREDALEEKTQCRQCQRTFFPLAAAQSRRAPKNDSKPLVYMIVGLVAVVVIG